MAGHLEHHCQRWLQLRYPCENSLLAATRFLRVLAGASGRAVQGATTTATRESTRARAHLSRAGDEAPARAPPRPPPPARQAIDETHTRKLSLTKFEHYCSCHTLQIVRDSFKQLDASHDRQVVKREFVKYFLGNGLSKAQCRALWDAIDANRNGKVSFVEYRDWAQETLAVASLEDVAASLGMSAPE